MSASVSCICLTSVTTAAQTWLQLIASCNPETDTYNVVTSVEMSLTVQYLWTS